MYLAKLASRNGGHDPSVTDDDLKAVVKRRKCLKFLRETATKKVHFL